MKKKKLRQGVNGRTVSQISHTQGKSPHHLWMSLRVCVLAHEVFFFLISKGFFFLCLFDALWPSCQSCPTHTILSFEAVHNPLLYITCIGLDLQSCFCLTREGILQASLSRVIAVICKHVDVEFPPAFPFPCQP